MPPLPFAKGQLFHMTPIERLTRIIDDGVLQCERALAHLELPGASIAHPHLKARRMVTPVPIPPYGVVADYVPFYLAPRSPMLYANYAGNVVGRPSGQDGIVYLITDVAWISALGGVVVTDRHPLRRPRFADLEAVADDSFIDWDVMFDPYFTNTPTDTSRTERRQAEVLVHSAVPIDALQGVATRTRAELEAVMQICARAMPDWRFETQPAWYF